jgi:predicted RNA-binding Zn-ribbon protein involved in translation (DUF1610 family)
MATEFTKAEVQEVGERQKAILWLLLASVVAHVVVQPALILTGLLCVVFVFKLAKAERSKAAWLWGALAFLPVLSLFALLVVNGKATRILRGAGLRVGIMGTNRHELESLLAEATRDTEPNHKVVANRGEAWTCPVCGEVNLEYCDVCRECGDSVQRIIEDDSDTPETISR